MKLFKILTGALLFVSTITYAQKKEIYANFPENFESPDTSAKGRYKVAEVKLKSGDWTLDQSILGALTGHDKFNPSGKQSVRMQQNRSKSAYVQMNFDLTDGASLVTFSYASYYKDASSKFRLEYSTDGGLSWMQAGNEIAADNPELKTAEFKLDVKGKVRFRINKLGLGDGKVDSNIKNGRLSLDDIAIYKN